MMVKIRNITSLTLIHDHEIHSASEDSKRIRALCVHEVTLQINTFIDENNDTRVKESWHEVKNRSTTLRVKKIGNTSTAYYLCLGYHLGDTTRLTLGISLKLLVFRVRARKNFQLMNYFLKSNLDHELVTNLWLLEKVMLKRWFL